MIKIRMLLFLVGIIWTPLYPETGFNAIQTQPSDEKIVTAGFDDSQGNRAFLVNRYNPDGSLDPTFNTTGFIITPIGLFAAAHDVAIQSANERIIAAGFAFTGATVGALARYFSTSALDPTFGGDGIVTTAFGDGIHINAIELQANGQVVAVGSTVISGNPLIFLARYNADGSLDSAGFGTGGIVTTSVGSRSSGIDVIIQPGDGRIVVAASADDDSFVILRYDTDGTLDNTFGTGGLTRTVLGNPSRPLSLARQADGQFVLAGTSLNNITLTRYSTSGVLDTNFGTEGIVATQVGVSSLAHSVKINQNGTIVIGGTSDNKPVNVKYTSSGALDPNFGDGGIVLLDLNEPAYISDIAIHPSNTGVISAGHFNNEKGLLTQLTATGILDCTFNNDGIVTFPPNPLIEANFLFAATTTARTLGTVFADIIFDINGPLKNWGHTPGSGIFTCQRSGTYLVVYSGVYTEAGLIALSSVSFIGLLNGTEITGTQLGTNLSVGIGSINITRNFIVTACEGDQLQLQHRRASTGTGTINLAPIGFGTTPIGGTITIAKLE